MSNVKTRCNTLITKLIITFILLISSQTCGFAEAKFPNLLSCSLDLNANYRDFNTLQLRVPAEKIDSLNAKSMWNDINEGKLAKVLMKILIGYTGCVTQEAKIDIMKSILIGDNPADKFLEEFRLCAFSSAWRTVILKWIDDGESVEDIKKRKGIPPVFLSIAEIFYKDKTNYNFAYAVHSSVEATNKCISKVYNDAKEAKIDLLK